MKRFIIFILLIIIFGLIGWMLKDNAGTLSITWFGYQITTSMVVALSCIILLFCLFYILRLPLLFIGWIKTLLLKNKQKTKDVILEQILNAIAVQDTQNTSKLTAKINRLFAVQSATNMLLKSMIEPSEVLYQKLSENPQTELAGWRGIIRLQKEKGEILAALDLCEKALKKYPHFIWLAQDTFDMQVANEKWEDALETLDNLRHLNALDDSCYRTKKATLLFKMGESYKAFKIAPWLPQIALAATKQKPRKAEAILSKSWENAPSWGVYQAYAELFSKLNAVARYKKIEKLVALNDGTRVGHLALADSALKAHFWGQAKAELDDYLANYTLSVPVANMMAMYEKEARHDNHEAQKWLNKTKELEPSPAFACTKCGHLSHEWFPICPMCGGFACIENH